MSNTYTWLVEAIDCKPTENNLTNVATVVHWRCNATDGTNNATVYGTVTLGAPDPANFIPFANLTLAQTVTWVQTALGQATVTATQTNLDTQIANLVNPPIVTPKLPWA